MRPRTFVKILVLGTLATHAGDKVGNSCKMIVCFKNQSVLKEILDPKLRGHPGYGLIRDQDLAKIESLETLDLHEARLEDLRFPGRGQIFAMKASETEWEWIERVKNRFAPQFPYIRTLIPPAREIFDQILIADRSVAPVDDAGSAWVFEPSACTTVTTALQKRIGELGRLQLDGRLYRHARTSSLSRAVMMLHELLYFVQLNRFHLPAPPAPETSAPTRALIGFLIQKNLSATPTVGALLDEMGKLGFRIAAREIHPLFQVDFRAAGLRLMPLIYAHLAKEKYESPFFKFRRDLEADVDKIRRTRLPRYPTLDIMERALEKAVRTSLWYEVGDCLQWSPTLQCENVSQESRKLFDSEKFLLQSYLRQWPSLKKEQERLYPKMKEAFATYLQKLFEKDFPATLFTANGHSESLNIALKAIVSGLYRSFWTDAIFRGDAANDEEVSHFAETQFPTQLNFDVVHAYEFARKVCFDEIRNQPFAELP